MLNAGRKPRARLGGRQVPRRHAAFGVGGDTSARQAAWAEKALKPGIIHGVGGVGFTGI
jgi:hypothetical protein